MHSRFTYKKEIPLSSLPPLTPTPQKKVMHAPTLTRREPPSKATYNIPEVVLKRRLVLEQSMQREVRRLEEEMIKGAAESKVSFEYHFFLCINFHFFHKEKMESSIGYMTYVPLLLF